MSAVLRAPALPVVPPRVPLAQRLRASLFPDALSGLITATLLLAALWAGWKLLAWGLLDAETAANPDTCRAAAGACWGVVRDKYRLVFLGRYPMAEQWRPVAASLLLLGSVGVAALPRFFGRAGMAMLLAGLTGFGVLMAGGVTGLAPVPSDLWGGLPLTLFLAVIACLAGVPLGILLALGRRSSLPLIRILCTGFIEAVRGVPLITLLFFGAFVLPMLVPAQWRVDPMVRIAVCLAAFSAAYLAEVFRGGLQAVPQGQVMAAQAMGFTRVQVLRHVVLPQALRVTIAPTVSNFIGAVKDTSLVAIVNIYDITGSLKMAMSDPHWIAYFVEMYMVVCAVYLLIGLGIARYGRFLESRYALQ